MVVLIYRYKRFIVILDGTRLIMVGMLLKTELIIDQLIMLLKMVIIRLMIKIHRMVIITQIMIIFIFMKLWGLKSYGKI